MSARPPIQGHEQVRERLAAVHARDEVPGSILVHGPAGVGKQHLGLWFARLLVCETPSATAPCDRCRSCRLALDLQHPDIHWFFPLPRPRVYGNADRLAEAFEEARFAELDARREEPLRASVHDVSVALYLAQARTIRRMTASRPAMADRKVFLIGDAELLVPQEASEEAANAVLKVLEEPPLDTTFILTATDPDALLPTIRSRLSPIRLRPLPVADVATFLREHAGADRDDADRAARLGEGSIGRALGFLPRDGEPGPLETLRADARALLDAIAADEAAGRLAAAHRRPVSGARGAFSDVLAALVVWLRDLAAVAVGAPGIVNADARDHLARLAEALPHAADGAPAAIRAVDETRALARFNINPQLATARMLRVVRTALRDGP